MKRQPRPIKARLEYFGHSEGRADFVHGSASFSGVPVVLLTPRIVRALKLGLRESLHARVENGRLVVWHEPKEPQRGKA